MFAKPISQQLFEGRVRPEPFGSFVSPVAPFEATDARGRGEIEVIKTSEPSLVQRLLNLQIDDAKLRQQRQALVSELGGLSVAAEKLISEVKQRRNELLESDLEEIRARGREQLQIIEALAADHHGTVVAFQNLREQGEDLGAQIQDLRSRKISRWASKSQRATHQKKIDAAQEELRSLTSEMAAAGQRQQAAWNAVEEARAAMKQISDAEFRCRGALSGKAYVDPEFGLKVTPQV